MRVTQAILAALEPRESISEGGEYLQNKSLEDESTDDDLSDVDDLQIPEPSPPRGVSTRLNRNSLLPPFLRDLNWGEEETGTRVIPAISVSTAPINLSGGQTFAEFQSSGSDIESGNHSRAPFRPSQRTSQQSELSQRHHKARFPRVASLSTATLTAWLTRRSAWSVRKRRRRRSPVRRTALRNRTFESGS